MGPLEVLPGRCAEGPAGPGRAGERDDAGLRRGDQRLADVGTARQHLQDAGRQPRLLEDAREDGAAGDRGARVGLEDDGVAERQRGGDRADGQDGGHGERRDDADDARGDAAGGAQPWGAGAQQLAVGVAGQRGGFVALLRGRVHPEVAEGLDRAGLAGRPAPDLLGVVLQHLPGPAQHAGALLERRGRQARCASAARSMARCTSSGVARPTGAMTSPVAGSTASQVPPDPSVHVPVQTSPCQAPSSSSATCVPSS